MVTETSAVSLARKTVASAVRNGANKATSAGSRIWQVERSTTRLLPMALKLGEGSEAYAPLARAIIGGLLVSVVVTVYLVPAAYVLVHRGEEAMEVTT